MSQTATAEDASMLHVVGQARVLVAMSGRNTVAHYDQMRTQLAERFPDLEFTFIECVTGLMVHQDAPPAEEVKA